MHFVYKFSLPQLLAAALLRTSMSRTRPFSLLKEHEAGSPETKLVSWGLPSVWVTWGAAPSLVSASQSAAQGLGVRFPSFKV